MKQIKVSNIKYLALYDEKYADEYSRDNEMSEEEKKEWLDELENNTNIIIDIDDDDDFEDDDELHNYLEMEELCEYISDFDWEYLEENF